jgi:hypothetical protein
MALGQIQESQEREENDSDALEKQTGTWAKNEPWCTKRGRVTWRCELSSPKKSALPILPMFVSVPCFSG